MCVKLVRSSFLLFINLFFTILSFALPGFTPDSYLTGTGHCLTPWHAITHIILIAILFIDTVTETQVTWPARLVIWEVNSDSWGSRAPGFHSLPVFADLADERSRLRRLLNVLEILIQEQCSLLCFSCLWGNAGLGDAAPPSSQSLL